ncbi:hypothetical protein [Paraburkholderia humisilvae]|uniref:ATP-grasp domain-containing protein n=1 Tax=Paraburkholderia humisilvae TaxID=627669 RepID=A0A6J5DIG1_9BURK|nr:hypothetical protein [Paraburkholderia humisilvae]CAB3753979.1 hypothetical protein LMG29542_02209 [Paraburkholderia humisilvae]
MERLLLVTNLAHEDRGEDLYLAERFGEHYDLTIASPTAAVPLLAAQAVDGCLIRNAWPGRQFKDAFAAIERLTALNSITTYNPLLPGRRGPVENKAYVVDLFQQGYGVIPSYHGPEDMVTAGYPEGQQVLAKPMDGCSSAGIVEMALKDSQPAPGRFVFQPKIVFSFEISFYFIDGHFAWAMRSGGPSADDRWDLTLYDATAAEVDWALAFVHWNNLPYGIERIDVAKLPDGGMLLMEVEDSTPMLSLENLPVAVRNVATRAIVESVCQRVSNSRPSQLASRRRTSPLAGLVAAIAGVAKAFVE